MICTPHLGASTTEAQVNVAIQVAEQISDYLLNGTITNAVNMPSILARCPKTETLYGVGLGARCLGGQIVDSAITKNRFNLYRCSGRIEYTPLTACVLADVLRDVSDPVNRVNAPEIAKSKGIVVTDSRTSDVSEWLVAITLTLTCKKGVHNVTGTLFAGRGAPYRAHGSGSCGGRFKSLYAVGS